MILCSTACWTASHEGAPEADKAAMRTELDQWKTEYSDLLK